MRPNCQWPEKRSPDDGNIGIEKSSPSAFTTTRSQIRVPENIKAPLSGRSDAPQAGLDI
jgi:hypothetical protein